MRVVDLIGQTFGYLRVIERSGSLRGARWKCLCDPALGGCGNTTYVCSGDFRRARPVRSCGCDRGGTGKFQPTHGHTSGLLREHGGSPTYISWQAMIQRCTNSSVRHHRLYGGRGIRIHAEWLDSFEAFLEYMGPRPSLEHSIDRFPDQDGNYEPGNVRWATRKEQAINRRTTKLDEWDIRFIRHWRDAGFSVRDISKAFGISVGHTSNVSRGVTR